ncbi:MAG: DUF996 domain-containing protein [Candidatus Thermoplasmatota archaeon]|nr:DUF996 domain-containing protein [Candidatus Thermoplasmatota archaeon]
MGKLSNAKVFGGIGAILMLVGGFIPFAQMILPIIGLVLLFVAVKYIADETKDGIIFRNYLLYFVCTIIAFIALIAGLIITIGGIGIMSELKGELSDMDAILSFLGGIMASFIVFWILLIIGTVYLRKSYNNIAKHTKVSLFRTTGTVYFIGAITLIIFIGALILLIAKILEIVAFFSLPDNLPAPKETIESEIIS